MRFTSFLVMLVVLGGCAGAVTDLAPGAAAGEVAIMGTSLDPGFISVDGTPCKDSFVGGNTIRLRPGEHEIEVNSFTHNQYSTSSRTWKFRYLVEAGHTYQVDGTWFGQGVNVIDKQSGVSVRIGQ